MKKIYQIEFSWKTPIGKRVTRSTSPVVFEKYDEALDYAFSLYEHSKRLSGKYIYRDKKLIYDYCIRHLYVNDDWESGLLEGGDSTQIFSML